MLPYHEESVLSLSAIVLREMKTAMQGESEASTQPVSSSSRWLSWSSLIFAFLQSACIFVLATSGIRVLIGLSSLAAAAGTNAPAKGFHQDAIRIPMMIFALAGALINLYAVWRVRSLRQRPSSQWRVQPVTPKQKRSEWIQVVLSALTLVLLATEWWTHSLLHHPH